MSPMRVRQMAASPGAKFIAGGTNLVDLMKMDVERPTKLIDITRLPLGKVEETAGGGLRIGALVRNTDLAYHPLVERRYPMLSSAHSGRRLAAIAQHGVGRAAISCSARAAPISTTWRRPATSASRAPAARPSAASTA